MNNVLVVNGMEFKFPYNDVSKLQDKIDSLLVLLKLSGVEFRFFMDRFVGDKEACNLVVMNNIDSITGERMLSSNLYIRYLNRGGEKIVDKFAIHPDMNVFDPPQTFDGIDIDGIIKSIDELIETL